MSARYIVGSDLYDLRDALLGGAECRFDPELHDGPDGAESLEDRAVREDIARDVCRSCALFDDCLIYAVRTQPDRGMWAGLTADEIRALAHLYDIYPHTLKRALAGEVA